MNKVRQKHRNGCGVAAVAMAAGITYDEALKVVHPNRKPGDPTRTPIANITNALFQLKVAHKSYVTKYTKIADLTNDAIVVYLTSPTSSHAVVWDAKKKRILDPDRKRALPLKSYQKDLAWIVEVRR